MRLAALLLALSAAAAAQPAPRRVDGAVGPAALRALLPTGRVPGDTSAFVEASVGNDVSHGTVEQSARVHARLGGNDYLYVTLSVATPFERSEPAWRTAAPDEGERVDLGVFSGDYRTTPGAVFLSVAVSPVRRLTIQGPPGHRDLVLATARALDLAAFAALPADHTVWVDLAEQRIVDPDAPDLPIVVRSPSRAALFEALRTPAGWQEDGWSSSALPLDRGTGDAYRDSTVLTVEVCFKPATAAEQAAVETPAFWQYRAFNPMFVCGVGVPQPPRPRACLTLMSASDAFVDSLLAEPLGPTTARTDSALGGQPALIERYPGGTGVILRRPGGLMLARTSGSLGLLDSLLATGIGRSAPPASALIAFDPSPRYTDQTLWHGAFTTSLVPGRVLFQREHPSSIQMDTAWPDGWTWTSPEDSDHWLWLAEAGPIDPRHPEALLDAAAEGVVLVFKQGIRPDALLPLQGAFTAGDDLFTVYTGSPDLYEPFAGWTLDAPPEPIALDGWPAAVRFTMHAPLGGTPLVAQAVDAVWRGADALLIVAVSRPEDAPRAAEALRRAVAGTRVRDL